MWSIAHSMNWILWEYFQFLVFKCFWKANASVYVRVCVRVNVCVGVSVCVPEPESGRSDQLHLITVIKKSSFLQRCWPAPLCLFVVSSMTLHQCNQAWIGSGGALHPPSPNPPPFFFFFFKSIRGLTTTESPHHPTCLIISFSLWIPANLPQILPLETSVHLQRPGLHLNTDHLLDPLHWFLWPVLYRVLCIPPFLTSPLIESLPEFLRLFTFKDINS